MSYTFVKVQSKVQPNVEEKPKSYWLFKPKTEEQIMEHWKKYAASTIKEGASILANKLVKGYQGHFRNDFERAVEVYQTAMGDDLPSSMLKVENEAMNNRLRAFREGRNIYLNHSIQVVMVDSRFVDIVDTVERDVLTFPDEDKPTIDDVKILVWDGGTHYYAKIGKLDIVDEKGNQKWNTRKEAEDAAKWYIEKYW